MDTPIIVAFIGVVGSTVSVAGLAIVAVLNHHLAGRVKFQQKELVWIKSMTEFLLSDYQRSHLRDLAAGPTFMARVENRRDTSFELELRHLTTLNFIERREGKGFGTLFNQDGIRDVMEHFGITARGRDYLRVFDEAKK